jgi:hypothetical protein
MKSRLQRTAFHSLALSITVLAGCGGGGGDSPTAVSPGTAVPSPAAAPVPTQAPAPAPAQTPASGPAPAAAPTNLNDPANAIRLAAAMSQTTWVVGTLTPVKWTGANYKVPSRTDLSGCVSVVYNNADGVPGVGDKFSFLVNSCATSNVAGSATLNRETVSNLIAISNPALPESGAWEVSESLSGSGTTVWDTAVTGNIRSKGQSTTSVIGTQKIAHRSDGSQQDLLQSGRFSAKGIHDGVAFDYVVETSYGCSYSANTKKAVESTCSASLATLKGNLNGGNAEATLVQTNAGSATFDIVQAGQTIKVSKNLSSGDYTVSIANGQQFVIPAVAFEAIARF